MNAKKVVDLKKVEHMGMNCTVCARLARREGLEGGYKLTVYAACLPCDNDSEVIDVYNNEDMSIGAAFMETYARTIKQASELLESLEESGAIDSLAKESCTAAYKARAKAIIEAAKESVAYEKTARELLEETGNETACNEANEALHGYGFQWGAYAPKVLGTRIRLDEKALKEYKRLMKTKDVEVLYSTGNMHYAIRLRNGTLGVRLVSSRSVATKMLELQKAEDWKGLRLKCHLMENGLHHAVAVLYGGERMHMSTAYASGKRESAVYALAKMLDDIAAG